MANTNAEYASSGTMTCCGCNAAIHLAVINADLSKKYALVFCPNCARRMQSAKLWIEVKPSPNDVIARVAKCQGCEAQITRAGLNMGIDTPIIFCHRCYSKMLSPMRWQEFRRGVRDEDLSGYAPRRIDFQIGSEVKGGH